MQIFYSNTHRVHNPPFELFDGGQHMPYLESLERMERILSVLMERDWAEILEPEDSGLDPILAVHDAEYVDFLRTAFEEWTQVKTSYEKKALLPATFPPRGWSHRPKSILGRAGYHMFDLSAPIMEGTYRAALGSANCALSGAKAIAAGEKSAFALCRPPGHHAGKSFCGGYCYLNNAAIAAHWLSAIGKVAILDIDYHAGNGTQDIFYGRGDVLTLSIHADPDGEYPAFCGYADATGAGQGSGLHRNFPLPAGTDDVHYLSVLDDALSLIKSFKPGFLVLSAGMDLYHGDPLGEFKVTKERREREERFKTSERGWLGLVGLHWLRDGENRIGSAPDNDIILPAEVPDHIGVVLYNNGVATFRAARGVPVYNNGKQFTLKTLVAAIHEEADFLQIGDLTLVLLDRAGRHLIRVWDSNSQLRKNFTRFNQYPVNPEYCIEARYTDYDTPRLVSIQDVLEIYHETPIQGYVTFKLQGEEYRLEAQVDEDDLMRLDFKDATNGDTTYVGGRFLVAEMPKDGKVIVDFNRAYNPPCAYTDFATCPLPPPENRLPIRVEAGEKVYREVSGHRH